jgi:hypothetical protein
LVEYLPAESEEEFLDFVEILSTYNAADVAVIKSLLDGEKIEHHFRGEVFNLVEPLVQPVRLFVREDQAEAAEELLKEVLIQLTGVSFIREKENDQE